MINKSNIVILSLLIFLASCKSKNYSYKEVLNINETHSIISLQIKKSLDEVLNDSINYSNFKSQVFLVIIKKKIGNYEICVSKTEYGIFKNNRPDNFNKLIGYSKYKNIPVLLFGDINDKFFKRSHYEFYNILGDMPEYDKNNPPVIYEPYMKCYSDR